jgi:Protein of unknown function (DUF2950)
MRFNTKTLFKESGYMLAGLLLMMVVMAGCNGKVQSVEAAETPAQLTFAAPEEAGQALYKAARTNDAGALAQILGSESKVILSSGDAEEDKAAIASFVTKYGRMNRWVTMTDGSRVLYIGADNYPYPIPLAQNASSKWYFNTAAGKDEILARRIGKNELLAIDAISAMARAEEHYYKHHHDGDKTHQYAQLILSSQGKQNGLYWEVPENEPPSPLGRLNEFANDVVTSIQPGASPIFDGYSFRVLTAQGDEAKGGAKSYVANGKMTGGFAILASPVTYGDSGMMTFIVSREGVVYQKDLGAVTSAQVGSINSYNPTDGWTLAE